MRLKWGMILPYLNTGTSINPIWAHPRWFWARAPNSFHSLRRLFYLATNANANARMEFWNCVTGLKSTICHRWICFFYLSHLWPPFWNPNTTLCTSLPQTRTEWQLCGEFLPMCQATPLRKPSAVGGGLKLVLVCHVDELVFWICNNVGDLDAISSQTNLCLFTHQTINSVTCRIECHLF